MRTFPLAQYVGLATLVGYFFTRDREKIPLQREVVLLSLLWAMFVFSSFFSLHTGRAWEGLSQISKTLLFTFLTISLCMDRKRLKYLLLTIVFSLGFYGVKGGLFSILAGGASRVMGPPRSFIAGNNSLGLALLMILPLLFYLAREEENKKVKITLLATLFLSAIAVIFTYSRGAVLGLAAVTCLFLLKFKKKFLAAMIVGVGVCGVLAFAPERWVARVETIQNYDVDGSVRGRFNAWGFAWNLALDRPFTGGGFQTFRPELFRIYAPDPTNVHDAHSIYFEVLGEQGFIGFGLFMALLISSWLSLAKLKRTFKDIPSCQWICNYSDMLGLSLAAYGICGAFLGLAYFDLYYHIVAAVVILKTLAEREYELLMNGSSDETEYLEKTQSSAALTNTG
jgi:probable O-glycosylation ligase (exosortase A-associated)